MVTVEPRDAVAFRHIFHRQRFSLELYSRIRKLLEVLEFGILPSRLGISQGKLHRILVTPLWTSCTRLILKGIKSGKSY